VLLRIPVNAFRKLLKQIPGLGVKFSKILSHHIRHKVMRTELVRKSPSSACTRPSRLRRSTYA